MRDPEKAIEGTALIPVWNQQCSYGQWLSCDDIDRSLAKTIRSHPIFRSSQLSTNPSTCSEDPPVGTMDSTKPSEEDFPTFANSLKK